MNGLYFTEWPKCPDCGLREAGTPALPHTLDRCRAVQSGQSLGGKVLDIRRTTDEQPDPPPPNFLGEKPPPGSWRDFFEPDDAIATPPTNAVVVRAKKNRHTLMIQGCSSCGGNHEFEVFVAQPPHFLCPRSNVVVEVKW